MKSALIISAIPSGVQTIVGESLTIKVRNSLDAIPPVSAEAASWLQSYRPSPQVQDLVLLAIEELVTNCIKYGYDDEDEHTIVIVLSINDENLIIDVIDDGHAFDPLAVSPPDFSLGIKDRPIGGLGIYLLRQLADRITCERRDGLNRLTLTKRMR